MTGISTNIAGVPVKVGTSVFYLALYVCVSTIVTEGYGGLAEAFRLLVILYVSIMAHEMAHVFAGRWRGVQTTEVVLWALGGYARLRNLPARTSDDLLMSFAGPASNLVLAVLALAIGLALPETKALLREVALVNIALALLNLLPAYPLDGGRMLHACARHFLSEHVAARATAAVAQVVAAAALSILVPAGLWVEAAFCLAIFWLAPTSLKLRTFWFVPLRSKSAGGAGQQS